MPQGQGEPPARSDSQQGPGTAPTQEPWGKGHQKRSLGASREVLLPAKGSALPEWELQHPQPGLSLSPLPPGLSARGWAGSWLRHHQSGHPDMGCPCPRAASARLPPLPAPRALERVFIPLREHHLMGKLIF